MISAPNGGKTSPTVVQRLIKFQSRRTRSGRNEIAFRHEFDPFSGPTHPRASPSPHSFARVSHSPRASHTRLFVRVPRDKPVSSLLPSFFLFRSARVCAKILLFLSLEERESKGSRPLLLARFSAREENNRGVNVGVSRRLFM